MSDNRFVGVEDRFGGVTVNSMREAVVDPDEFNLRLLESLQFWISSGKRGIWFKVYLENANWIPVLAKKEFTFHHAQSDYAMMIRWLPKVESCAIPGYPHNYVGVGAFVVNDKEEVLVVKERYFVKKPFWKIPGGYVERGEDLGIAAEREVFEETGIKAKFLSLVAFRHSHQLHFKCSDLYFVCQLKPQSESISKCEREILDCKWMPIQEYCNDPGGSKVNQYIAKCYFENKEKNVSVMPFTMHLNGNKQSVYSVTDVNLQEEI